MKCIRHTPQYQYISGKLTSCAGSNYKQAKLSKEDIEKSIKEISDLRIMKSVSYQWWIPQLYGIGSMSYLSECNRQYIVDRINHNLFGK